MGGVVRCDSSLAYLAIRILYVDAVPLVIARHKDQSAVNIHIQVVVLRTDDFSRHIVYIGRSVYQVLWTITLR
jgi:hypothetical protein